MILNLYACWSYESKGFKLNWDFTLTLFRNFHMIKWAFTNNWNFTLVKGIYSNYN